MGLWLCDPNKNTKCMKTNCIIKRKGNPCYLTRDIEYARLDHKGQPIDVEEEQSNESKDR